MAINYYIQRDSVQNLFKEWEQKGVELGKMVYVANNRQKLAEQLENNANEVQGKINEVIKDKDVAGALDEAKKKGLGILKDTFKINDKKTS